MLVVGWSRQTVSLLLHINLLWNCSLIIISISYLNIVLVRFGHFTKRASAHRAKRFLIHHTSKKSICKKTLTIPYNYERIVPTCLDNTTTAGNVDLCWKTAFFSWSAFHFIWKIPVARLTTSRTEDMRRLISRCCFSSTEPRNAAIDSLCSFCTWSWSLCVFQKFLERSVL